MKRVTIIVMLIVFPGSRDFHSSFYIQVMFTLFFISMSAEYHELEKQKYKSTEKNNFLIMEG